MSNVIASMVRCPGLCQLGRCLEKFVISAFQKYIQIFSPVFQLFCNRTCKCLINDRRCVAACNDQNCNNINGSLQQCCNVQASLIDITIQRHREAIMRQNPRAFDLKFIDEGDGIVKHNPGCNCEVVHCATKHYVCVGILCTGRCKCPVCRNPI